MADDLKDLAKGFKNIQNELNKASDKILKKIQPKILSSVKKRWLDGNGVSETGGSSDKLKALKPSTIKSRTYKKNKGKLSALTDPTKSNLIDSGKTFKQLGSKIDKENLEIGVLGDRQDVLSHTEKERPLMYLSDKEMEIIDSIVDDEIDNILKNL